MIGRNLKLLPVMSAMLICLAACGYHFSGEGTGPKLSGDGTGPKQALTLIAIPVFDNKTSEPNLGAKIAEALRQEFIRRSSMKVVPVEQAEAVFRGTVTSIRIIPIAHHAVNAVANQITTENMLWLTVDISCEEKKTHKTLWRNASFSDHQVYQINNNAEQLQPVVGYDNRQAALDFLARDMSRRIHDNFLSNF